MSGLKNSRTTILSQVRGERNPNGKRTSLIPKQGLDSKNITEYPDSTSRGSSEGSEGDVSLKTFGKDVDSRLLPV